MHQSLSSLSLFLICLSVCLETRPTQAAPADNNQVTACKRELENANKTISQWGNTLENIVNDSKLPPAVRETIHNEANLLLDMIEDWGEVVGNRPAAQLVAELINIRRRSNRLALDIYLREWDMRLVTSSVQVGVLVDRVQQACLDRQTIQRLESPPESIETLLKTLKKNQK